MTRRAFIEDGFRDLQGDLGHTFKWWNGVDIECIPSKLERGNTVVVGAKEVTVALSLYVLREHFISADSTIITADSTLWTADNNKPHPIGGRVLTYKGKQYRVLSVAEDPSRSFYKIVLGDVNSGR